MGTIWNDGGLGSGTFVVQEDGTLKEITVEEADKLRAVNVKKEQEE
jgi:hypothetical protein